MRILIEAVAAVLFVISTGLLFSERVRASRILFVMVGVVTLASSYVITKHILDATVERRMHHHQIADRAPPASPALPSASPVTALPAPAPAPRPAENPFSADKLLQALYISTEGFLERIVRSGTGQPNASVSSDTVVDVIVGLSLAVLGLLSQLFALLWRRLRGGGAAA